MTKSSLFVFNRTKNWFSYVYECTEHMSNHL